MGRTEQTRDESAPKRRYTDHETEHGPFLSFHRNRPNPLDQLPFVGSNAAPPNLRYWNVPSNGGYGGGCETGEALALLYLQYLRHSISDDTAVLGCIVGSMRMRWIEACRGDAASVDRACLSLRGQSAGFMRIVNLWLAISARDLGDCLDQMDENDLLRQANGGLR